MVPKILSLAKGCRMSQHDYSHTYCSDEVYRMSEGIGPSTLLSGERKVVLALRRELTNPCDSSTTEPKVYGL